MPAHLRALNAADAGPIPQEALDFFEAKEIRPGFSHLDVWGEEHTRAFTAAKFMREDVLAAVQASLATALREGHTYEQWARGLQPELERLGFWGQQRVVDPLTGREVEISVPHRLEHIFRQNMRTARAAGQWERIQRTKASHPYLLYLLGPSERHRPEHAAWHGLLLPVDDPFWQRAFPPNGHGCKCHVRQVSRREGERLERDGIRSAERTPILDEQGLPTGRHLRETTPVRRVAPPLVLVPFENKRTGVIEMVPQGIDPGFAHPPSQLRNFQGGPNRPPTAPAVPVVPPLPPAPTAPAAPPAAPAAPPAAPARPRRTRAPVDPNAPPRTRRPRQPKVAPDDSAYTELRASVFEGTESVPRRMTQREVGRLLGEALTAKKDGGAGLRRLGRALVRAHLQDMMRTGLSEAPDAGVVVWNSSKRTRGTLDGNGRMTLSRMLSPHLRAAAKALAAGEQLSDEQAHAIRTLLHETIHGFGRDSSGFGGIMLQTPAARGIEEVTTEALARQIVRESLGAPFHIPTASGVGGISYNSALRLVRETVESVALDAGVTIGEGGTPDAPAAERTAAAQAAMEAASREMRAGALAESLADAPSVPSPSLHVWNYVAALPLSGNTVEVQQARRRLYERLSRAVVWAGKV